MAFMKQLIYNVLLSHCLTLGTFCYGKNPVIDSSKLTENKEVICKTAFECYPFGVIFSKTAPSNLDTINFDMDFCYFYFSPGLEERCLLKRENLCDGKTNAKKDFPDYLAYFKDDCKVMQHYTDGKVLAFSEPWAPPGIQSYIYTRKTALLSEGSSYMLGCFDLVDDITLGIAKFKRVPHNALRALPFQGLHEIPETWFYDAFMAFPNGMAIVLKNNTILYNKHWLSEETIDSINQLFKEYGFTVEGEALLTSSTWITNALKTLDGQSCDIGTYGIQVGDDIAQVLILRPIMTSAANPSWQVQFVQ